METANKIIQCEIVGTAPLLCNRFFTNGDESHSSSPGATKKVYDPKTEAEIRLYKDSEGRVYQPAEHVERAMQKAGTNFKFTGKKTYLEFIKSGVFVKPATLIHLLPDWEIDSRMVVVQRNRILRSRPIFNEWKLQFEIEIINENITAKAINDILCYAGKYIGLGDYRPKYGRFIVSKFKEVK